MKKGKLLLIVVSIIFTKMMYSQSFNNTHDQSTKKEFTQLTSNEECEWNGIKLYGKVKFVEHFPDIKIQYVEHFPNLKVKFVEHFPDKCGKWQEVEHFPDFTVKIVDHFPDIKVQKVEHFPGIEKF